jgi:hypothetical protein
MLEKIHSYFGGIGKIRQQKNVYRYEVYGTEGHNVIRAHFTKYPLFTYKAVHFQA